MEVSTDSLKDDKRAKHGADAKQLINVYNKPMRNQYFKEIRQAKEESLKSFVLNNGITTQQGHVTE